MNRPKLFAALLLIGTLLCSGLYFCWQILPVLRGGDVAIIEISTLNALHGKQFVGPYSRFEWDHPGPLYFYLLLPLYVLSGLRSWSLELTSTLLTTASLAGIVILAAAQLDTMAFFAVSTIFGAFLLHFPPGVLTGVWNPWVTILPLALLAFLMNSIANRNYRLLPVAALVASFLMQTHIQYVPVAGSMALAGLGIAFVSDRLSGLDRKIVAITAGVLLLVWLPPLWEELRNNPGNLTRIWSFFTEESHDRSTDSIFQQTAGNWSWLFKRALVPLVSPPILYYISFAIQLTLFLLGSLWALRSGRRSLFTLSVITACGTLPAFISAQNIPGEIPPHLVMWFSVLGACSLIPAAAIIAHRIARKHFRSVGAISVGLLCLFAVLQVRTARMRPDPSVDRTEVIAGVSSKLERRLPGNPGTARVTILSERAWPSAAGVILQLYKAGIPVCVREELVTILGSSLKCPGVDEPPVDIVLGDATTFRELVERPDYEAITDQGPLVAFVSTSPRLSLSVYPRKISIAQMNGVTGSPDVLFDGIVSGQTWDSPQFLILNNQEAAITLMVPSARIAGIRFWAHSDDTYVVKGSGTGEHFFEIGRSTERFTDGVAVERVIYSDRIPQCRYLQISAREGDGRYSIAEIQMLKAPG